MSIDLNKLALLLFRIEVDDYIKAGLYGAFNDVAQDVCILNSISSDDSDFTDLSELSITKLDIYNE